MAITRQDVEHVAYLARLGLSEDEIARFTVQLDSILANMQILGEVDTGHIAPTAQVIPLANVMRPDEVLPPLSQRETLANAPASEEAFFVIPAVFEEQPYEA